MPAVDSHGAAHLAVRRLVDADEHRERVWDLVTSGAPYPLMTSLAGYAMSTVDHAAMPWFRTLNAGAGQTKSAFTSRNSSSPCAPCSRPRPDCL